MPSRLEDEAANAVAVLRLVLQPRRDAKRFPRRATSTAGRPRVSPCMAARAVSFNQRGRPGSPPCQASPVKDRQRLEVANRIVLQRLAVAVRPRARLRQRGGVASAAFTNASARLISCSVGVRWKHILKELSSPATPATPLSLSRQGPRPLQRQRMVQEEQRLLRHRRLAARGVCRSGFAKSNVRNRPGRYSRSISP